MQHCCVAADGKIAFRAYRARVLQCLVLRRSSQAHCLWRRAQTHYDDIPELRSVGYGRASASRHASHRASKQCTWSSNIPRGHVAWIHSMGHTLGATCPWVLPLSFFVSFRATRNNSQSAAGVACCENILLHCAARLWLPRPARDTMACDDACVHSVRMPVHPTPPSASFLPCPVQSQSVDVHASKGCRRHMCQWQQNLTWHSAGCRDRRWNVLPPPYHSARVWHHARPQLPDMNPARLRMHTCCHLVLV
jgi:hypothetical protein